MTEILTDLTIVEAKKGLKDKRFSAVDLMQAHLDAIADHEHLNAFITVVKEQALEQAAIADKHIDRSEERLLKGIPLGMKDLFCTKGVLTTAGSKMLSNFIPPYESTVSEKLKEAGAIVVGKTNMDEFAMGSSNTTSYYGPVINPWHQERKLNPGGSSGGSAAAVAAGLCMGATGTDTGGSIRQPAAFTGIVGLKPTYGRCSRWGCIAFASSLDTPGPMARTVEDVALLLEAMSGHDPKDSTSAPQKVPCFTKALGGDIKGLKVGLPREYFAVKEGDKKQHLISVAVQKMMEETTKILENMGAEVIDISLPHTSYALPAYYIIAPAEASANLARYDGLRYGLRERGKSLDEIYALSRSAGFGDEVKRRILMGTAVLSAGFYDAYYMKAAKIRRLIAQDFAQAFEKIDVILTPTTLNPPLPLNVPQSPIDMYYNDVLTVPANLAGLPAISFPGGLTDKKVPLGLHLIGRAFDEETILRTAWHLEKNIGFKNRPSEIVTEA